MSGQADIVFKVWGSRGSIFAGGSERTVFGGDTTCFSIETDGRFLVVDAGSGLRALGHECVNVADFTVFTSTGQMGDRVVERRTRCHQILRQIEHGLERCIAYDQPQVAVIDRQGLRNQVQACHCHGF